MGSFQKARSCTGGLHQWQPSLPLSGHWNTSCGLLTTRQATISAKCSLILPHLCEQSTCIPVVSSASTLHWWCVWPVYCLLSSGQQLEETQWVALVTQVDCYKLCETLPFPWFAGVSSIWVCSFDSQWLCCSRVLQCEETVSGSRDAPLQCLQGEHAHRHTALPQCLHPTTHQVVRWTRIWQMTQAHLTTVFHPTPQALSILPTTWCWMVWVWRHLYIWHMELSTKKYSR